MVTLKVSFLLPRTLSADPSASVRCWWAWFTLHATRGLRPIRATPRKHVRTLIRVPSEDVRTIFDRYIREAILFPVACSAQDHMARSAHQSRLGIREGTLDIPWRSLSGQDHCQPFVTYDVDDHHGITGRTKIDIRWTGSRVSDSLGTRHTLAVEHQGSCRVRMVCTSSWTSP